MSELDAPPLLVVAYEGIWGFIYMIPLHVILQATPAASGCDTEALAQCSDAGNVTTLSTHCQAGTLYHEDTTETFHMMHTSTTLATIIVIYMFCILGYNVAGMYVTRLSSASARTLFEACRVLAVWGADFVIYYGIKKEYGEQWTKWDSCRREASWCL